MIDVKLYTVNPMTATSGEITPFVVLKDAAVTLKGVMHAAAGSVYVEAIIDGKRVVLGCWLSELLELMIDG